MFLPQNSASGGKIAPDSAPEKYFTSKELIYAFILINILIVIVITSTIYTNIKKTAHDRISNGQLIISETTDEFIPLDGDWDFEWYPEIPEKIDSSLIPDYFSGKEAVPGYWKSGSNGLGVYRLKINHGDKIRIPAVKLTNVMDTYKVFINRKDYYSAGIISPDPDIYVDESRPAVIPFNSSFCSGETELCIMVGNLTEKRGGLNRPVYFGEYSTLINCREKKLVYNSILQGISLTVIFYNILFLFMNRKRGGSNNIYLIVLCVTIIMFCGLKQEMMLKTVFTGLTGEIRAKMIYLSFLLPFPVFACYIKSAYDRIFGKKTYTVIIVSAVLLVCFVLFFKSSVFSKYLLYLEALNLLLAVFLISRLFYLFIKTKETTPLTQLIGMYIFITAFIAAVLDDNLLLPADVPFLLFTCFIIFLTAGNTMLSIRAFNKLRQLHNALITSEKDKEKLRKLSYIDPLTEISNRRHFDEFINLHWERNNFIGESTAVFMIDIDNFKLFNDTYGHQEGDICLKKTAAAMSMELNRENDIIFRYGGEEFVIIISSINAEDSLSIAEKIRANVENLKMPNMNSLSSHCVTVSIGISYHNPALKQSSWKKVLKEADTALYQAKTAKNCCVMYENEKNKSGDKNEKICSWN